MSQCIERKAKMGRITTKLGRRKERVKEGDLRTR